LRSALLSKQGSVLTSKVTREVNRDLKPFQINNFRKGELIDEE
jgi:hypothetical protein